MTKPLFLLFIVGFVVGCRPAPTAPQSQESELQDLKRQVQQLKEQSATPTPSPKVTLAAPRLSGSVFYRFDSGSSTVVRAATVYVLTPLEAGSDSARLTKETMTDNLNFYLTTQTVGLDLRWPINRVMNDGGARFFRELDGVFRQINGYANRAAVKTTTNVDGRYAIPSLPEGKYHVVALLETNDAKGFWYVPVDLTQPGSVVLDLNNTNIKVFDVTGPLK